MNISITAPPFHFVLFRFKRHFKSGVYGENRKVEFYRSRNNEKVYFSNPILLETSRVKFDASRKFLFLGKTAYRFPLSQKCFCFGVKFEKFDDCRYHFVSDEKNTQTLTRRQQSRCYNLAEATIRYNQIAVQ
jgi:hypothetical protein